MTNKYDYKYFCNFYNRYKYKYKCIYFFSLPFLYKLPHNKPHIKYSLVKYQ